MSTCFGGRVGRELVARPSGCVLADARGTARLPCRRCCSARRVGLARGRARCERVPHCQADGPCSFRGGADLERPSRTPPRRRPRYRGGWMGLGGRARGLSLAVVTHAGSCRDPLRCPTLLLRARGRAGRVGGSELRVVATRELVPTGRLDSGLFRKAGSVPRALDVYHDRAGETAASQCRARGLVER
jgi:hypothetical protein